MTTNYDNVLEHALALREEVFEVVAYVADGDGAGKFLHYPPFGDAPILITNPSTYDGLSLERTTILKIHGTFDRMSESGDSYVISENQYIDYLTTDTWDAIPAAVTDRLKRTHFLFLGYAMRDWNLMVVLRRLGLVPPKFLSWAIQLHQTELDKERWTRLASRASTWTWPSMWMPLPRNLGWIERGGPAPARCGPGFPLTSG